MKLVIDNYFDNAKKIIKFFLDVYIYLLDNIHMSGKLTDYCNGAV